MRDLSRRTRSSLHRCAADPRLPAARDGYGAAGRRLPVPCRRLPVPCRNAHTGRRCCQGGANHPVRNGSLKRGAAVRRDTWPQAETPRRRSGPRALLRGRGGLLDDAAHEPNPGPPRTHTPAIRIRGRSRHRFSSAARQRLGAPIVLLRDDVNVRENARLRQLAESRFTDPDHLMHPPSAGPPPDPVPQRRHGRLSRRNRPHHDDITDDITPGKVSNHAHVSQASWTIDSHLLGRAPAHRYPGGRTRR